MTAIKGYAHIDAATGKLLASEAPPGGGTVTDVTASVPLASSGGVTPNIALNGIDWSWDNAGNKKFTNVADFVTTKRLAVGGDAVIGLSGGLDRLWDYAQTITDFSSSNSWSPYHTRIILDSGANIPASFIYAHSFNVQIPVTNTKNYGYVEALDFTFLHRGSGSIIGASGGRFVADNRGSGHVGFLVGMDGESYNSGTGVIDGNYGGYFQTGCSTLGGTITDNWGVYIDTPDITGTITNNYGLYIANQNVGTTLKYAIYSAGGLIHLGGNLDVTGTGIFTSTLLASNLSGTNTGDQTITLTGDVTGSGTSSFVTTIANNAVTTVKINNGAVTEAKITLADNTTGNVTSIAHGFAPKSGADATTFLNGAATPAYASVKDSDLSTTDIITNNVSTAKHGFTPKLPNDATKYLDGTGAYTVPAGSGSGTKIAVVTTPVTVNNTTTETDIFNVTIPANTLSTNNGIFARLAITNFGSTLTGLAVIKLKYGSTAIATSGNISLTNNNGLKGYVDILLLATGATNTQLGSINFDLAQNLIGIGNPAGIYDFLTGTAAEDSTGALALSVTITFSAASANNTITVDHAIVTKIN